MTTTQTILRALLLLVTLAPAVAEADPLYSSRFLVFDTELNLVDAFAERPDVQINQFEFLSDGNLLALFYGQPIHVYTSNGVLIDTFGESLAQPLAVAVNRGSSDEIYIADGAPDLIRVFDNAGLETRQITNPEFNFPTLLTFDEATGSLVTDINFLPSGQGPDLVRIDLNGNILARNSSAIIFGTTGGGIHDVTPSGNGTFYVTSTLNTEVAEVDQDLQLLRRFPTGAVSGGLRILSSAISPDGAQLYVADFNHYSGAGILRIFDSLSGDPEALFTHAALNGPVDLHFDSRGFLFIADFNFVPPVPEPSSLALVGLGVVAAVRRVRKTRRVQALRP